MIFDKNSLSFSEWWSKSWQTWTRWACWSLVIRCGTNFAATRCIFNSSVKMWWQEPTEIPHSSASFLTVRRRFARTGVLISSMCVSSVDVEGHPDRSSSSTDSRPFLKRLCHLKRVACFMATSPKAMLSMANVFVVDFPSLTQNFTANRCSFKLLILKKFVKLKIGQT